MVRRIGAVLAGFLAFVVVVLLCLFAARASWPAYAQAEPARAYGFGMFLARLTAGSLATLAGGGVAARVDRRTNEAALLFGFVLLLISVAQHIGIWNQYPVWYHLCWFACIVPCSLLGGRLSRQQANVTARGRL